MTTFTYDIQKHFTEPDRQRLVKLAAAEKKTVGDLIEETLKRAIFSPLKTPTKKKGS